jgi:hypothetical protein
MYKPRDNSDSSDCDTRDDNVHVTAHTMLYVLLFFILLLFYMLLYFSNIYYITHKFNNGTTYSNF